MGNSFQEKEIIQKENLELELLSNLSRVLTQNGEPAKITEKMSAVFEKVINTDQVNIFIYDENTKTLRDFAKSWVIIDEFHTNSYTDKLYIALAQFCQYDFFINDKPFTIDQFQGTKSIKSLKSGNTILFPLMKSNKPYGIIELVFETPIDKILKKDFFSALSIAAYQISLKIQNRILMDQMQTNIDFHEAMKNIAKIIETQYELNYIIPLIGEMIDKFIADHLIYIFLKKVDEKKFQLVWPLSCRNKKVTSVISKLNSKSKYLLTDNDKMGVFPLFGDDKLLGCVVAHSNIDKLNRREIEYLEQLTKQSSITIHRANIYAEILQHATLDALTGLNNRRQFETRIRQEIATVKRQKKPLCAMMIDVDFFKNVNDTYGHVVGDEVLKGIATLIRSQLRESDIASRYGGEEFSILLPYTQIEEAFGVAQRLRAAVEEHSIDISHVKDVEADKINITVSIGVNQYIDGDTPETLYGKADKALYKAKKHGRNKVVIYQE